MASAIHSTDAPIILLHSALGTHREMLPIAALFPEREVILLDLPEHGNGPEITGPLTTPAMAEWLLAELRRRDLGVVDAIGYSLGGYVALEAAVLAHARGASPIRSIVSHAMKFYWTVDAIESAVQGMDYEALESRSPRFIAALEASHRTGARRLLSRVSELISNFRDRQLSVSEIASAGVPILLTTGERDEMVTAAEVNTLATSLREAGANVREAIVAGVQHPIKTLDTQAFGRAAEAFWKATTYTSSSAKTETI